MSCWKTAKTLDKLQEKPMYRLYSQLLEWMSRHRTFGSVNAVSLAYHKHTWFQNSVLIMYRLKSLEHLSANLLKYPCNRVRKCSTHSIVANESEQSISIEFGQELVFWCYLGYVYRLNVDTILFFAGEVSNYRRENMLDLQMERLCVKWGTPRWWWQL